MTRDHGVGTAASALERVTINESCDFLIELELLRRSARRAGPATSGTWLISKSAAYGLPSDVIPALSQAVRYLLRFVRCLHNKPGW